LIPCAPLVKDGQMVRSTFPVVLVIAALVTVSCGGPVDPSKNTTDTFSGTVAVGNVAVHAFDVPNTGEFKVTLRAFSPGNPVVGILWGQSADGVTCQSSGYTAQLNVSQIDKSPLAGPIYVKGKYCVELFDPALVGGVPMVIPQTYRIDVSHP
jgi:hypothetical protein